MEIRITKKLLNNYQRYKREIPFLKAELDEMQISDAGIGNSTILDYRDGYPKPQSVVGFDWPLYERRQQVLKHRKEQVAVVEQWIKEIQDGQIRSVFRMRYIEGQNWVKIAEKTGYGGNPDYPRIVLRDRYLEKCGIK